MEFSNLMRTAAHAVNVKTHAEDIDVLMIRNVQSTFHLDNMKRPYSFQFVANFTRVVNVQHWLKTPDVKSSAILMPTVVEIINVAQLAVQ